MKKFTKTPRGKVVDGSGQPRREGYSEEVFSDGFLSPSGSSFIGFSESKGLLRNCLFIDLLGSDLNELVLGVLVTVSPCGQGGGPPVHAVSDVHLRQASVVGSSGPEVDLVGNTSESVRGVLGGVSTFLDAVFKSHSISVSNAQLDIITEGHVDDLDGSQTLFFGHIAVSTSKSDPRPDFKGIHLFDRGKAEFASHLSDLVHVHISLAGELDGGGNGGGGNEAGSFEHLFKF